MLYHISTHGRWRVHHVMRGMRCALELCCRLKIHVLYLENSFRVLKREENLISCNGPDTISLFNALQIVSTSQFSERNFEVLEQLLHAKLTLCACAAALVVALRCLPNTTSNCPGCGQKKIPEDFFYFSIFKTAFSGDAHVL